MYKQYLEIIGNKKIEQYNGPEDAARKLKKCSIFKDVNISYSYCMNENMQYNSNVKKQHKNIQNKIIDREVQELSRLLNEASFETGYESLAECYFKELSNKYGAIADIILQSIYVQNMYNDNKYILKHLLFIIGNLTYDKKRGSLQTILLAGLSNTDIEIQDLSVKCIEAWEAKEYLPTLINLRDKTGVEWFKDYINDVIDELSVELTEDDR